VEAEKVDRSSGMVCDFALLKRYLKDALSRFDHAYLNEVPPFDEIEPSSENIAAVIYGEIELCLAREQVKLSCVEVWETPMTGAVYSNQV
jgi:6-pyruvoyltetrahydropterin/6-carboxytetrahydropterin synthase